MYISRENSFYYYKYSMLSFPERICYYELIYKFISRLIWEYPNFRHWYENLFDEDKVIKVDREILICEKDFQIVGVAILKSNQEEKKICTLRVAREFQRQGIGRRLMELGFEWLQTDKPMITMHKSKQHEFASLMDYYGFELEQQQQNYYHIFSTEYVYNGLLPEKAYSFNKIELLNIYKLYQKFIESKKYDFNAFLDECVNMFYRQEQNRRLKMIKY